MSRKQLLLLFFGNLIPYTFGFGLMPLLPLYAGKFEASEALTGYYLAISMLALTVGTIFAGWMSDKFQRRRLLLILSGALAIPLIWMMGQASNIWQLTIATVAVFFLIGRQFRLLPFLPGYSRDKTNEVKYLGISV